MRKTNGIDLIHEALPVGDARAGHKIMSVMNAAEMARACDRALARRGIFTTKFNKMDLGKGNKQKHQNTQHD
jgi:hypothetical protein